MNYTKVSDINIGDLEIEKTPYIEMMIGNKEDAKYAGGFNLFGRTFGDYEQDILMELEYH